MARGPDGQGGGSGFSLKDQLFNAETVADLAAEYGRLDGFDPQAFQTRALSRFPELGLLERLDWMADCLEQQLPHDFPAMADALEQVMPTPLDPMRADNDFGRFIHAVPGILAVRHGLVDHRDRALDLIYQATQRFSMEFYIRPFLNRWPDETLARLHLWAEDDNYHVRRLVSEGTRPKLPWARGLTLDPLVPLALLDKLHADPTRYVTRSVANHMNDISKIVPDRVFEQLGVWHKAGRQTARELDWMTRHALRTAIKRGEPGALRLLGYDPDIAIAARIGQFTPQVARGDALAFEVTLTAKQAVRAVVDYRLRFARPGGRSGEKVFKLTTMTLEPGQPVTLTKRHVLKADASTFRLHPGPHCLTIQINGRDVAETTFAVI